MLFFYLVYKFKGFIQKNINRNLSVYWIFNLGILSFIFLMSSFYLDGIDYHSKTFTGNYFAVLFSGSLIMLSLPKVFCKLKFLGNVLSLLGNRSLFIFPFHLPFFEVSKPLISLFLPRNTFLWELNVEIVSIFLCLPVAFIITLQNISLG